jgi:hypothetical protein
MGGPVSPVAGSERKVIVKNADQSTRLRRASHFLPFGRMWQKPGSLGFIERDFRQIGGFG